MLHFSLSKNESASQNHPLPACPGGAHLRLLLKYLVAEGALINIIALGHPQPGVLFSMPYSVAAMPFVFAGCRGARVIVCAHQIL